MSTPLFVRRRELAKDVLGRRRLYLDINRWNDLVDAELCSNSNRELQGTLQALREAVSSGSLICPIEATTFVELTKQKIATNRSKAAELIDELSRGVSIVVAPERVFLETLRFIQAAPNGPPFPPAPIDEVWTKLAYFVGHGRIEAQQLTESELANLNEQFAAYLWEMPLAEMFQYLDPAQFPDHSWTVATADRLNAEKIDARKEFTSYRKLYLSEVRGALDAYQDSIGDVIVYEFHRKLGETSLVPESQKNDSARQLIKLIHAGFVKNDLARQMPTIHISATLFAHVQWDARRKYEANDFADFGHAAAAVAYCSAFATERSLGTLLDTSGLAAEYGCNVLKSVEEMFAWIHAV